MKKLRLTWKMEPRETGLRAIGAAPRGSKLHDGNITYAMTYPNGGGWSRSQNGWYWVAGWDSNIPHANTYQTPLQTEDEAKAAAKDYVMKHLQSDN